MKAKRILIVDDHQLVLDGISGFIKHNDRYELIGQGNNGEEAIKYADILSPDLILMDIDMPIISGIQATREIKRLYPNIKIIIISMHNEKGIIKKVLNEGADGYLIKNSSKDEMIEAIDKVLSGEKYFSEDVSNIIENKNTTQDDVGIINQLTQREIEIIEFVALGLTNKEIAEKLFISHRTVDTHRTNVMKKIKVTNVAGLIRFAFSHKLIQ